VDDLMPDDALGHWRLGNGQSLEIVGPDFIEHVRNIEGLRADIDSFKNQISQQTKDHAEGLANGECITLSYSRNLISLTMPGVRWGAFGTIHHRIIASSHHRIIASPHHRITANSPW
jgi:hypothetical protein